MATERLGWAVAAVLCLLFLLQSARLALARSAPRRRLERARKRGLAGERGARALLEREGYRIEAHQPALVWAIECDGAPYDVELRADLLVSRGGARFVAEVKTGAAAELAMPATRRQLLEYSVAYGVDGVLLVDMEQERIREVRFPLLRARRSALGPLLTAAACAAALAWIWLRARS
jgi:hypothetical protein